MISRWIGWHEVPIGRQPQPLPALEDLVFCGLQDVHFVGDNSSDAPPCKFKMKPENYRWHLFEDEKSCANTLMFELNMWVFWGLLRVYEKLYVQDKTGWWFQNVLYFHPYLAKWSNLTNIFQRGWSHQPENEQNQCPPCFFDHQKSGSKSPVEAPWLQQFSGRVSLGLGYSREYIPRCSMYVLICLHLHTPLQKKKTKKTNL